MTGNDRKIMFILAAISAIIGVMLATQLRSNLYPQQAESRSISELRSTLQKELEKHKTLLADISKYELLFYQYETALDEGESVEVMKEELARARKLAGMVSVEGPGVTVRIVDLDRRPSSLLTEQVEPAEGDAGREPGTSAGAYPDESTFPVPAGQVPQTNNDSVESFESFELAENGNVTIRTEGNSTQDGGKEGTGDIHVEGPPPLVIDQDLRMVVNELLVNGAKAVSLNGHRLIATSSIRNVGSSIQVDTKFIKPPYVFKALGDPETLISGLKLANIEGIFQIANKAVLMEKHDHLVIPAYQGTQTVRYMRPVKAKGES